MKGKPMSAARKNKRYGLTKNKKHNNRKLTKGRVKAGTMIPLLIYSGGLSIDGSPINVKQLLQAQTNIDKSNHQDKWEESKTSDKVVRKIYQHLLKKF